MPSRTAPVADLSLELGLLSLLRFACKLLLRITLTGIQSLCIPLKLVNLPLLALTYALTHAEFVLTKV
jgi:hypothetical protein